MHTHRHTDTQDASNNNTQRPKLASGKKIRAQLIFQHDICAANNSEYRFENCFLITWILTWKFLRNLGPLRNLSPQQNWSWLTHNCGSQSLYVLVMVCQCQALCQAHCQLIINKVLLYSPQGNSKGKSHDIYSKMCLKWMPWKLHHISQGSMSDFLTVQNLKSDTSYLDTKNLCTWNNSLYIETDPGNLFSFFSHQMSVPTFAANWVMKSHLKSMRVTSRRSQSLSYWFYKQSSSIAKWHAIVDHFMKYIEW